MPAPHVRIVANPYAAAGKVRRQLPELRALLAKMGVPFDVAETRCAGDGARLAREAQRDGVEVIAVVGGDGTLNEVAHAYLDENGNPVVGPDIVVIPTGTGGDFRKTVKTPLTLDAAVRKITNGVRTPIDLGYLECTSLEGATVKHTFINITSFGIGGVTDRVVNQTPKWLGGKASFYIGTVRALVEYKNTSVKIHLDGKHFHEGKIFNVALANGRFFGGGMMIAPNADLSDGIFEVVALCDMSIGESLGLSGKIYKGEHLTHPKVSVGRAEIIEAWPSNPTDEVLIDMDGETPGKLPLKARVVRKAATLRI